jgi:hypothetical protein
MTPNTRPSRVAEWAELVGDTVPDVVRGDEATLSERVVGADTRWADVRTASDPS